MFGQDVVVLEEKCLRSEELRLHGSGLEHIFYSYLFPPLCAIAIVGNCLNLIVLLSAEARTRRSAASQRSSGLLVALAFFDILFLLLMVPHSLANFENFGMNFAFRDLYLPLKLHLVSLANWCSAVAIWLVIAICAERLLGIRSLLRANGQWAFFTTLHLVIAIVVVSGLLTFYKHFSQFCVIVHLCHSTQVASTCQDVLLEVWQHNKTNIAPVSIRLYVRWSMMVHAILGIMVPILIMVGLNIALLFVVRKQSFLMYSRLNADVASVSGGPGTRRRTSGSIDKVTEVPGFTSNVFRRSIDQTLQFQAEHRVTVTVCAIVTCFTITQGPSAVVLSIIALSRTSPENENELWYNVQIVTNCLVIVGKALNFVLFCLSSSSFRRRLKTILKKKFLLFSRRSSFLMGSSTRTSQNSGKKNPGGPVIAPAAETRRLSLNQ